MDWSIANITWFKFILENLHPLGVFGIPAWFIIIGIHIIVTGLILLMFFYIFNSFLKKHYNVDLGPLLGFLIFIMDYIDRIWNGIFAQKKPIKSDYDNDSGGFSPREEREFLEEERIKRRRRNLRGLCVKFIH